MSKNMMWIDGNCFKIPDETAFTDNEYEHLYNIVNSPLDDWTHKSKFKLPHYYSKKLKLKYLKDKVEEEKQILLNDLETENSVMIEVHGNSIQTVGCAMKELHTVIAEIRSQSKPLQFISIPTISDEIKTNFLEFKDKVVQKQYKGVEESIFQKAEKLHLTITVLSLFNSSEIEEVTQCLQKYKKDVFDNMLNGRNHLSIILEGLDSMQTDLKKCHVLYAKAKFTDEDENCDLQAIVNSINNFFYIKGFCKEQRVDVKLHATLMNTKYRKVEGRKKFYQKRLPFNAVDIMKDYKDHYFGKCNFNAIDLSLMSSVDDNGYYKSLATVQIFNSECNN